MCAYVRPQHGMHPNKRTAIPNTPAGYPTSDRRRWRISTASAPPVFCWASSMRWRSAHCASMCTTCTACGKPVCTLDARCDHIVFGCVWRASVGWLFPQCQPNRHCGCCRRIIMQRIPSVNPSVRPPWSTNRQRWISSANLVARCSASAWVRSSTSPTTEQLLRCALFLLSSPPRSFVRACVRSFVRACVRSFVRVRQLACVRYHGLRF